MIDRLAFPQTWLIPNLILSLYFACYDSLIMLIFFTFYSVLMVHYQILRVCGFDLSQNNRTLDSWRFLWFWKINIKQTMVKSWFLAHKNLLFGIIWKCYPQNYLLFVTSLPYLPTLSRTIKFSMTLSLIGWVSLQTLLGIYISSKLYQIYAIILYTFSEIKDHNSFGCWKDIWIRLI